MWIKSAIFVILGMDIFESMFPIQFVFFLLNIYKEEKRETIQPIDITGKYQIEKNPYYDYRLT